MKAARFDYLRAASIDETVRALAASGGFGKVLAGGQSLGPMMNLRLAQPESLVDVQAVPALSACVETAAAIVLGAGVTHAAIEDGKVPDPTRGMLPRVARDIAYRAVRNRGTLGGSLAHADPAADWINAMAVLDAALHVVGPAGTRVVCWADWMVGAFTTALGDDELLAAVSIPRLGPEARWSYYKFNRKTGEFAEAIAAFVVDPARGVCRAVIGAIDGAPYVIEDASALVVGWSEPFASAALEAAGLEPGSFEYRTHATALRRAAHALADFSGEPA